MAVEFSDYFWGEEHNGWNVLYQNMKQGHNASKELAEFFKERWSIDETYCKALTKLANKANTNSDRGTLAPIFGLLKTSLEMMSSVHLHMVNKIQDHVKEMLKYNEELHKKQKVVKDEESQTEEVVKLIQATSALALKAKDTYSQRCQDFEKAKRDSASPKDIEKAEVKLKKAHDDYKALVDKYNTIRDDFEKKMTQSCKRFQTVEESHLTKILHFGQSYINALLSDHKAIGQIHSDLTHKYSQMTIDKLLDNFAINKHTGLEKPVMMVFEDASSLGSAMSGQQSPEPTGDHSKSSAEDAPGTEKTSGVLAGGFLRSRRDKKKEKKGKKKKDTDSPNNKDDKSDNENSEEMKTADLISVENRDEAEGSEAANQLGYDSLKGENDSRDGFHDDDRVDGWQEPRVDKDGFMIRPDTDKIQENSFDSSSDSDSDVGLKKIHVEIKPITNGTNRTSASVDELRATIEGMSFSPLASTTTRRTSSDQQSIPMRRSNSTTQPMSSSSSDLLGLNFNLPAGQPNAQPSQEDLELRDNSPSNLRQNSPRLTNSKDCSHVLTPPARADRYAELSEIMGETSSSDSVPAPALPPRTSTSRGSTPTPSMALPRPPSRKMLETVVSRSTSSALSRAESSSSLEFRTSGMIPGISRGPSPLTLGMADTIPLAVAFQEHCHAYFRGTAESRVQMKVTGEMMVSFPAGIVAVLANNPSPAQLSFKVVNFNSMDSPLPNKQLVQLDQAQSTDSIGVYNFNMDSLASLLRRQAEQSPSASFFNVDIIKYQVSNLNGAKNTPLQLVSYWRCEDSHTDLRVDYKYNSSSMCHASPLLNVNISVPVDGVVRNMQSKPHGQWLKEQQKAQWKIAELSESSSGGGKGSLRGKFEVSAGPSTPTTVSAQFICEGTTLSGLDFGLLPSGYRLSLVKKRFVSGKYICDADAVLRLRYGAMPS